MGEPRTTMKQVKCPICNGKGLLPTPNKLNKAFKIELDAQFIAKSLKAEKYSLREIARLMGYNNPQSIKHLLETTKKWEKDYKEKYKKDDLGYDVPVDNSR